MARIPSIQSRRRTGRRYAIMVFAALALIGGWTGFWFYAAGRAQQTIDGWRAREAQSGRIYSCGTQALGGFPFRFEVDCQQVTVDLRGETPPLEVKAGRVLAAAQIYDPTLLVSEFSGPLTVAPQGGAPFIIADWKLGQSSVRGTPHAPERASTVFDQPVLDRMDGDRRQNLLRAQRLELHGRIVEGSAASNPAIELVLRLIQASAPVLPAGLAAPADGEFRVVLRGLKNFAPKPWPARFREIQAANGGIEIVQARVKQGDMLAVGGGTLSLNANGYLQGELRVTIAGLESFLKAIGAEQMVQRSPHINALAGTLNRLAPGLGDAARQQAGANVAAGVNMLGQQTVLEGRSAVSLPLRFDNGAVFLGPIPVGKTPALF